MLSINDIKKPIAADIDAFEEKFRTSMKSSVPLLDRITHYIVKRKGKQIRPMFVFFSASICGGINEATHRGAALVELLHTASLVHDDVVDNSYQRRGFFSINALWKNKIAVLVGDYLLSKGLLLSIDNNDFQLLRIVSDAVKQMSEGELMQIEKVRRMDIGEPVYYDVIRQKTASLIASCCEKIGIAFQIKDDMFDFGTDDVGKPLGIDIKEKKVTLPLIYALANCSSSEKKRVINLVKNHNEDPKKIAEIIRFVQETGGLQYAETQMKKYQDEAFEILNTFPDSDSHRGLKQLVRFTTERNK
jgi:octaprenyl-diphosphate synthase